MKSVRGDAILFFSMTSDDALDSGSLHGACPVVVWTKVDRSEMDSRRRIRR